MRGCILPHLLGYLLAFARIFSFLQCKCKHLNSLQLFQYLFRIDCHFPSHTILLICMKWPSLQPIPTTYSKNKRERERFDFSMWEGNWEKKNPLSSDTYFGLHIHLQLIQLSAYLWLYIYKSSFRVLFKSLAFHHSDEMLSLLKTKGQPATSQANLNLKVPNFQLHVLYGAHTSTQSPGQPPHQWPSSWVFSETSPSTCRRLHPSGDGSQATKRVPGLKWWVLCLRMSEESYSTERNANTPALCPPLLSPLLSFHLSLPLPFGCLWFCH